MRPKTANLLRSLSYTFETAVQPAVVGDFQKSLCLTMNNIFRYAIELVEHEHESEYADVTQLHGVLIKLRDYFDSVPEKSDAVHRQLAALRDALRTPIAAGLSPQSLDSTSLAFKQALDDSLKLLIALPADARNSPDYHAVRYEIRRYLADNLLREKALMEKAFTTKRR
jgi:hypothetical protein